MVNSKISCGQYLLWTEFEEETIYILYMHVIAKHCIPVYSWQYKMHWIPIYSMYDLHCTKSRMWDMSTLIRRCENFGLFYSFGSQLVEALERQTRA